MPLIVSMANNKDRQELFEVLKTNPDFSDEELDPENAKTNLQSSEEQTKKRQQNQKEFQLEENPETGSLSTSEEQQTNSDNSSSDYTLYTLLSVMGIIAVFGAYYVGYSHGVEVTKQQSTGKPFVSNVDHTNQSPEQTSDTTPESDSSSSVTTESQNSEQNTSETASQSSVQENSGTEANSVQTGKTPWYHTIYLMYWKQGMDQSDLNALLKEHRNILAPDITNVAMCKLRIQGASRNALCVGRWNQKEGAEKGLEKLKQKIELIQRKHARAKRYDPGIAKISQKEAEKIPNN